MSTVRCRTSLERSSPTIPTSIEPLSLDEAYLDVTDDARGIGSATAVAAEIRARIREVTGLTASAGVSYNKFIAKLASDQNKPDGMCVIRPAQGPAFVAALPVKRFHGVGPVTAARMAALGIVTGVPTSVISVSTRCRGTSAAARATSTVPPTATTIARSVLIARRSRSAPSGRSTAT